MIFLFSSVWVVLSLPIFAYWPWYSNEGATTELGLQEDEPLFLTQVLFHSLVGLGSCVPQKVFFFSALAFHTRTLRKGLIFPLVRVGEGGGALREEQGTLVVVVVVHGSQSLSSTLKIISHYWLCIQVVQNRPPQTFVAISSWRLHAQCDTSADFQIGVQFNI